MSCRGRRCGRCRGCRGRARFAGVPAPIDDVARAASGRTTEASCLGYACTDDDLKAWKDAARNWHAYAKFLGGAIIYGWGEDTKNWPPKALDAAYRLAWVQERWHHLDVQFDPLGMNSATTIEWAIKLQVELRRVSQIWRKILLDNGKTPPDPKNMEETTAAQTQHQAPTVPDVLGPITEALPWIVGGLALLFLLPRR
jgi:hypothetical protein